jgi:hypothetical protein
MCAARDSPQVLAFVIGTDSDNRQRQIAEDEIGAVLADANFRQDLGAFA